MKTYWFAVVASTAIAAQGLAQTLPPGTAVWKDKSGMFEARAEFVRLENGLVRLKTAPGKHVDVPLAKLDAAGRALAEKLGAEQAAEQAAEDARLAIPPGLDPVELLKKARAQFERIPAEFRNDRAIVPLAIVECLYGDREDGRAYFSKLLADTARAGSAADRFAIYSKILEGQAMVGLNDDARDTIRIAAVDARKSADTFGTDQVLFYYGKTAIRYLASVGAGVEAGRFIRDSPAIKGDDAEFVKAQTQFHKFWASVTLVTEQAERIDKELAKMTLIYAESSFPLGAEAVSAMPALWYRLGEREKGIERLEAFAKRQAEHTGPADRVYDAYEEFALACAEADDRENAFKYLEVLQKRRRSFPDYSLMRIKIQLGDFEGAAAEARRETDEKLPAVPAKLRRENLLKVAVAAARARKGVLADALLLEADELASKFEDGSDPQAKLQAALARFAAGDIEAMVKTADEIGIPMMQYVANLFTAAEFHVRTTKKGKNVLLPGFEL